MSIYELSVNADALFVTWVDCTTVTPFPTIWLRDNCPSGVHPQTQERMLDLLTLDDTPLLKTAKLDGDFAQLSYVDGHVSRIPVSLLSKHRPGQRAADPAAIENLLWRKEHQLARFSAKDILADDASLHAWMRVLAADGLTIVENLADRVGAGVDVAERIGFLRKTNFGTTFEVINKPDPNNLAYTSHALPLHTDLPNQEVPPGYQFLHCLANEAVGGGSLFADGFAMAKDLRTEDPEAFRVLCDVKIPFRFHDQEADILVYEPVITLNAAGAVVEIRYNAHIAGVFDMPADIMPAYYRAYRAYMSKTRDAKYRITLKLKAGEMAVFDNRRILHGRDSFDPSTGFRHLHGCYVDRGEFASRLRLLSRQAAAATAA